VQDEHVDDYDLSALVGSQVRRVAFDDRVSLLLVDGADREQRVAANLVIEAAIELRGADGIKFEVRPGVTASLAPLLGLLRCRLTSVAFDGRKLSVSFDDGSRLAVFTGERYEAWDLRGVGVPNLSAGPWCLTDDPSAPGTHDPAPAEEGASLPHLDAPVYGLSPSFEGRRALGTWDSNLGEQFLGVILDHGEAKEEVRVTVATIAKSSPLLVGPGDVATGPRITGFEAAVSQALFGLVQLEMPSPGEERSTYLRKEIPQMDRLALDLSPTGWERIFVSVADIKREAYVHRSGGSWAAAIDLDARVGLAVWGRGIEPSELELVAIDDLGEYAAPVAGYE
jgi:hypothetical protein